MTPARRIFAWGSAAGVLYAGASFAASRSLARRLISAEGLGPTPDRAAETDASLRRHAAVVGELRHPGSDRLPVELAATFASPGDTADRPTILFLHGKGGHSSEWEGDALRALRQGYNVLLPDLRGHGRSGGSFFTFGYLEKEDLAKTIEAAARQFGIDPGRLGIHSCSAGSSVALEFAAVRSGIRAIWLESPFAQPREMARHYLSRATGIPGPLLALASHWAVARAVARVARELGLRDSSDALTLLDPLSAVSRVTAAVMLVHGEDDGLVPAAFTARLAAALPPRGAVWNVAGAGHCHHEDAPSSIARLAYERKWKDFFRTYLPA